MCVGGLYMCESGLYLCVEVVYMMVCVQKWFVKGSVFKGGLSKGVIACMRTWFVPYV